MRLHSLKWNNYLRCLMYTIMFAEYSAGLLNGLCCAWICAAERNGWFPVTCVGQCRVHVEIVCVVLCPLKSCLELMAEVYVCFFCSFTVVQLLIIVCFSLCMMKTGHYEKKNCYSIRGSRGQEAQRKIRLWNLTLKAIVNKMAGSKHEVKHLEVIV